MQAAATRFISDLSCGASQALVVWSATAGPPAACPACPAFTCECSPTYSLSCPRIDGSSALQVVASGVNHCLIFVFGLLVVVFALPAFWGWRASLSPSPSAASATGPSGGQPRGTPTAEEIRALASRRQAGATGLQLHPDKTKIMHNMEDRVSRTTPEYTDVGGLSIEVLPFAGTQKYLGRMFTFSDSTEVEVEARIKAAWKKFGIFKSELTSRSYSLHDRLRLFSGTVTPTFLYGSACWTITRSLEQRIRSTQRKMLRMIFRVPRRRLRADSSPGTCTSEDAHVHESSTSEDQSEGSTSSTTSSDTDSTTPSGSSNSSGGLEPWHEWIQRATRYAMQQMEANGYDEWVVLQRRYKWDLAQHLVTTDRHKWSNAALH